VRHAERTFSSTESPCKFNLLSSELVAQPIERANARIVGDERLPLGCADANAVCDQAAVAKGKYLRRRSIAYMQRRPEPVEFARESTEVFCFVTRPRLQRGWRLKGR
jgi:transposase